VRQIAAICLILLAAAATTACDDTNFTIDPLLYGDTVELAAPTAQNASLPSALDITVGVSGINGGRFPERSSDAEEWDFAVRLRNGEVVLLPAAALGLNSRAALTRAQLNTTFEAYKEAPGRASFFADSALVLRVGEVYAARSRVTVGTFTGCEQYAKLQPLEVNHATGFVRLRIVTNERCGDPRLVEEG